MTDEVREQFEKWFDNSGAQDRVYECTSNTYCENQIRGRMWEAWQEADKRGEARGRLQGLEEAAKICEAKRWQCGNDILSATSVAAAIREKE